MRWFRLLSREHTIPDTAGLFTCRSEDRGRRSVQRRSEIRGLRSVKGHTFPLPLYPHLESPDAFTPLLQCGWTGAKLEKQVMMKTKYPYVLLDDKGVPFIEGTSMKVTELVVEKFAYAWSPEELHLQHPYLSLGQIHAALAYYWDHSDELDRIISERLKRVEGIESKVREEHSAFLSKLKAKHLM